MSKDKLLEKAAKTKDLREKQQDLIEQALAHYYDREMAGKSRSFNESGRKFGVPGWKVRDLHNKLQKELAEIEERELDNE